MMRKVAVFVPSLDGGGAERMMINLSAALRNAGLDVTLISSIATGMLSAEVADGLRVRDLGCRRVRTALWPLTRTLRELRPEVLVSTLNYANLLCIVARRIAGFEFGLVVREANTPSVEQREARGLGGPVMRRFQRWLYPWADRVIAVSGGVAQDIVEYIGLSPACVDVIENPVVTEKLRAESVKRADHPWLEESTCPVFLSVGRLAPQKDHRLLITAFSRLAAKQRARLIILGEGDERSGLTSLIESLGLSDCIDLPGYAANPYAYMSKADVFVLSSRWEGLPNSIIEALACGARVVATDCPSGPRDILRGGEYGELVPVGDVEAMSGAMSRTLLREHDVSRQLDWVTQWSDDHIASRYIDLFARIEPHTRNPSRSRLS